MVLYYHRAGALPHWHPVRFRGVDSIVRNDVKLKVCRVPQPHASPVARVISSITCIAVHMRACSHEPPCSHLLTVIGVRPMIAGNTGPRKSTFKSTSTVLPEYQVGVFCPALSHPRTHHPPTCTHWRVDVYFISRLSRIHIKTVFHPYSTRIPPVFRVLGIRVYSKSWNTPRILPNPQTVIKSWGIRVTDTSFFMMRIHKNTLWNTDKYN